MAGGKKPYPHYLVQEPSTGLYAAFTDADARLTYAKHATRFPSAAEALIAISGAGLADQPHELVRVDA